MKTLLLSPQGGYKSTARQRQENKQINTSQGEIWGHEEVALSFQKGEQDVCMSVRKPYGHQTFTSYPLIAPE